MESDLRFWKLSNQNNAILYLDWQTGEQLQAALDQYKEDGEKNGDLPLFWTGEDITGAPITIRIDFIRDLIGYSPEQRARQEDIDGPLEEIRQLSIEGSKKKWEADDENGKGY